MKKGQFTEEQIIYVLRQAEAGTAAADVCRELGVSEHTFSRWKRTFAGLGIADLRLDKHLLQEALRKNWCSRPSDARRCPTSGSASR